MVSRALDTIATSDQHIDPVRVADGALDVLLDDDDSGTSVGKFGRKKRVTIETDQPKIIPISPPNPVSTTASVRN